MTNGDYDLFHRTILHELLNGKSTVCSTITDGGATKNEGMQNYLPVPTCGLNEDARHALCSAMRHYACSAQYVCMSVCLYSLCTVSVQWSVAQSACVLRALSVHAVFSFTERGCRRHDH